MKFTPEQTAQILEVFKQIDNFQIPAEVENRRSSPRVKFRVPLVAVPVDKPDTEPVRIFGRDLSSAGIGFLSRRYFSLGERVVITLRIGADQNKLVLARITFARYLRKAYYDMGAQFMEAVADPYGFGRIPTTWLWKPADADDVVRNAMRITGAPREESAGQP